MQMLSEHCVVDICLHIPHISTFTACLTQYVGLLCHSVQTHAATHKKDRSRTCSSPVHCVCTCTTSSNTTYFNLVKLTISRNMHENYKNMQQDFEYVICFLCYIYIFSTIYFTVSLFHCYMFPMSMLHRDIIQFIWS